MEVGVVMHDLSTGIYRPAYEFSFRCLNCQSDIQETSCPHCNFTFESADGIVRTISPDRLDHYAQFIKDYEHIRAAEGRGDDSEEFYLALPHQDTTGCNRSQWNIRSKSYDYLMRYVIGQMAPGSRILDLGAGNCWMSFQLTRAGYSACAVDLLTNRRDGLGAATHFRRHLPAAIPRFQAELHNLPFSDHQFDAAVFNASFHYSEDYERTLSEALRCLKHGGQLIIMDTPWYSSEESGEQMIAERHAHFQRKYMTASDSVRSMEFLTDGRLHRLEQLLSIRWRVHHPWYGLRWAMRPWLAKIKGRREPSRFHIYVADKHF
jgi:SAM-dependent methyltransferase